MKVTVDNGQPLSTNSPAQPELHYVTMNNPTRTVVNDSSGNWLATLTNGARTVTLRGQQRIFTEHCQGIQDTFGRDRASSWGPAETGGVWYHTGDGGGDFTVAGGVGTMRCTTSNSSRRATVSNIVQNVDATVKIKTDKTAAGDAQIGGIIFGYQNIDNHYLARLHFVPAIIQDTFDRTFSSGWDATNSSYSWSTSGGSASDYSVNGSEGIHSVDSINVSRRTYLAGAQCTDFDTTVKVKTNVLASGASEVGAILGRYQDSNNHYLFRIRFTSSAGREVYASIQRNQGGTITTLGSETTTTYTHTADTYYCIRAQAAGTTLRMRVWPDGQSEPDTWDVSLTDSTFSSAGAVGVRSILITGNTNTLPVLFTYDNFSLTRDGNTTDSVRVSVQSRVASTYTTIASDVTLAGVSHVPGDWFNMHLQHTTADIIRLRAWKDGTSEPSAWDIEFSDSTFTAGRVGLRALVNTGTTNLPVTFSYDNLVVSASWVSNPTVRHNVWVRLLDAPFSGTVNETWLLSALSNTNPDALAIAMQYIYGALPVTDPSQANMQIMGDSSYGPLDTDGTRQEGSDFNDYLGINWQYGGYTDTPEVAQFRCTDCSGFVRMVYGYRLGMNMTSSVLDGVSIPRTSGDIANSGPGIFILHSESTISDVTGILPGDIVAFDADTSNPDEEEGQIDHVGIYLGIGDDSTHRFMSSRKTGDGPTFADVGGPSTIASGTNLYSRSLRVVRRF
jgi:hypothetical protein